MKKKKQKIDLRRKCRLVYNSRNRKVIIVKEPNDLTNPKDFEAYVRDLIYELRHMDDGDECDELVSYLAAIPTTTQISDHFSIP